MAHTVIRFALEYVSRGIYIYVLTDVQYEKYKNKWEHIIYNEEDQFSIIV